MSCARPSGHGSLKLVQEHLRDPRGTILSLVSDAGAGLGSRARLRSGKARFGDGRQARGAQRAQRPARTARARSLMSASGGQKCWADSVDLGPSDTSGPKVSRTRSSSGARPREEHADGPGPHGASGPLICACALLAWSMGCELPGVAAEVQLSGECGSRLRMAPPTRTAKGPKPFPRPLGISEGSHRLQHLAGPLGGNVALCCRRCMRIKRHACGSGPS